VIYGPCKTWIAWFVTEPELFATGAAVALTPPTVSARVAGAVAIDVRHSAIAGRYLLCLLRW
jgi:hypothetical protein